MLRKNQQFLTQVYMVADLAVIQASFLLAWWLRFESGLFGFVYPIPIKYYLVWSLVYGGIALLTGLISGLYSPKRRKRFADDFIRVLQTHIIGFFLLLGAMYFAKEINISRSYLFLYMVFSIFFIVLYRYGVKQTLRIMRRKGYNKQYMLIIGAGALGRRFHLNMQHYPELGYEIVGFLDDELKWKKGETEYPEVLGKLADLRAILDRFKIIDEVILALPYGESDKYPELMAVCEQAGVHIMIVPDYYDFLPTRPVFDNFAGMPLINVREVPLDLAVNRFFKRLFDILFAGLAIIITSPIMLAVAIGVKMTSPGPVIFKQERVGFNRRTFQMYKFRSMQAQTPDSDEEDTGWTTENDPRRTKFGTFIRRTSLDELPQFFNVLLGQMSVVGPRPERPHYVELFREKVPNYMLKHHVLPGITGYAQCAGLRGDTSIEKRIEYDLFYIENWTLLFDLRLVLLTIYKMFTDKSAY
ncbi:undecaprenyl-phosphate glucose phosphotransferase [Saccharibacillus kuerlensis]|uniref:Undecaprenyl-phosphate glucose phosphotransferase n=1 Tax=Saccharibacillus kuerlensis TaxID=459527 RepID=A0ABQ2KUD0_9BACL|nr:undecaprenyl-phosphate glucose phosphotransferase [Saccharibacillus kuerlensis]GGN92909.1 undecaprenyl-phosphate glucose phosphotransferase [Saccharibacillus kuerlensis]